MECDAGASSLVIAQSKTAEATGTCGPYTNKTRGNLHTGDEGILWKESGFFIQGSSSGFDSDVGSRISNEGSRLRVNGPLVVGMSSSCSSIQRVLH